ncbi:MAG: XdhC family protein [Gemmatimonadota bacterium]|nr:XdhC family protein [Gemmatimonadota bacterium]
MRDIDQIRDALAAAHSRGETVTLATVMFVEGSVYRGAGARMVVDAGGETVGAVSGGCLEADVVARAPEVLAAGVPELVRYDTRASDDVVLGLGLGCQGIIDLLLEPLGGESLAHAAAMYDRIARRRERVTLLTLVQSVNGLPIGTRALLDERGNFIEGESAMLDIGHGTAREEIEPAVCVVICGGGTDAVPLARLAKVMGWHVTVIDHRAAFATTHRFPGADTIVRANLVDDSAALGGKVHLDQRTMAVVMAHSASHDRAYLHAMLSAKAAYIGVLGPRRRTLELLGADVAADSDGLPPSVHSPVGLDLGAETPDEIALAIVAEIAAVSTGRSGGMLRQRQGPIHDRRVITVVAP